MIEALYKYIYKFSLTIITLSSIALSSDESELLENNYISTNHPICKALCLDFYINEKPYIGLHLKISHNFVHYKAERYNKHGEDYDNVLDTYEWLSKKMIQLCCKYKKMLKVPLDTYLKSCIYNK